MTIALDAMGGDHAPKEIVAGAVLAAPQMRHTIALVGEPSKIQPFLPTPVPHNIVIHPASQTIEMGEKPIDAIRKKKDASLVVAIDLVAEGHAGAVVSAGNTGAATAGSLLRWRQMPGVHRPAIASIIPNKFGGFLLLDAGASPDVEPEHLVEFGLMGRAYAQKVLKREQPKVHLLNIGEEEGKGNAFAKQAHQLLSRYDWFSGNIEGKDLFRNECDVIVCDAFVGNIVLKTCEGVAEFIMQEVKEQIPTSKIAQLPYLMLRKVFGPLRKKLDYAEYGGSPLLGLNGLCIICHGRSNARAIMNALLVAQTAMDSCLVETIRETFSQP